MMSGTQETLQELKSLRINIYRSLHLNARNENMFVVDEWIEKKSLTDTDLERLLNHVHVYDFFRDVQNEKDFQELADEIERSWKETLARIDPMYKVDRYEDYGPVITFFLERGKPDVS